MNNSAVKNTATLLITCPDSKGLVAAIAEFLYQHNANILHADQHQDAENNLFLMRVEWDLTGFSMPIADFEQHFTAIAARFNMEWQLKLSNKPVRVAIMVSQYDHCLADLLHRHKNGELEDVYKRQVLDDAAKQIVELAAPYARFPDDIRNEVDILSITRTWTFTKEDSLATQ